MKKIAIYSLVGLITLSCSVSPPNNLPTVRENFTGLAQKYNFADLEKEYKPFSTKALSYGYVQRMFTKFLVTTPNPTQVIRQLEFARYLKEIKNDTSYFDSIRTMISNDNTIFTKINTASGVPEKKTSESSTFGAFVDSLNSIQTPAVPSFTVSTLAGSDNYFTDGTGTNARFYGPGGVALDGDGNVYVADQFNSRIRKITPDGSVSTLAGSGTYGFADGTGTNAQFGGPASIAVDASGNVYVADRGNNRIRKITPDGSVSTLAGYTTFDEWGGTIGDYADGTGTNARFNTPSGVALDSNGNVYVTDSNNNSIRKITPAGVVTTLAGDVNSGFADGAGTNAKFNNPYGVAVDASGNVYVADVQNFRIRKITPAGSVSTLAGDVNSGFADGAGTNARFNNPTGVAVDGTGNVYVADAQNHRIREITTAGVVITLAGDGTAAFSDGTGTNAELNTPTGVTVDSAGNVYVADQSNNRIRKIAATGGVVSTLAGNANSPFKDGIGTNTYFLTPAGVAVDGTGNVYVADSNNNRIRKITPAGSVSTLAGDGNEGYIDSTTGTNAEFYRPTGVAVDSDGNVYVADLYNNRIRKITPAGSVSTLAGSTDGYADGTDAKFSNPTGVAVDGTGNVYVADSNNNRIRKITPAGSVSTVAGQTTAGSDDGTDAKFTYPTGVAVDSDGNVYVADYNNNRIRKITPAGSVSTFAGDGNSGDSDGTNAQFSGPGGVAVDASGNVYVADQYNQRIRKITPAGSVSTVAGSTYGYADGTNARFAGPSSVAVDGTGNVYVADQYNNRIRKITH